MRNFLKTSLMVGILAAASVFGLSPQHFAGDATLIALFGMAFFLDSYVLGIASGSSPHRVGRQRAPRVL